MATKVTDLPAVTQPFISSDNLLVSKHVTITSGLLTIGEEYTILDFNTGDNFSNVATVISGVINTTGCVFTATGTTPTVYSNGSTLAYYQSQKATITQLGGLPKVYKALLTQTGTSAPVATVLVNTLSGTPVWTRLGVGNYNLTLVGEFITDKTYIPNFGTSVGNGRTMIQITNGASLLGYLDLFWDSEDVLILNIYDTLFAPTEFSTLIGATKISLPPIEVYPV